MVRIIEFVVDMYFELSFAVLLVFYLGVLEVK